MDPSSDNVLHEARAAGFALAGISSARPSAYGQSVRQWIADGQHGEMHYLETNLDVRLDPARLLDGARSVIALGEAYCRDAPPVEDDSMNLGEPDAAAWGPRGRVARYAWGQDYHKVLKKRLHTLADTLRTQHPDHAFRCTVDTAPVLEREHAARAGLGWQAKNTMLIHPRHGSFFLVGLIVTTLPLDPRAPHNTRFKNFAEVSETPGQTGVSAAISTPQPDGSASPAPGHDLPVTDHCARCTRCIDACPTDAIDPRGYRIDATRCVSYLTIEHRSPVAPALHAGVGDWLAGCDICQEVCPYNQVAARHPLPIDPRYLPRRIEPAARVDSPAPPSDDEIGHDHDLSKGLPLVEVIRWTDEDRARSFRGSALKRVKLNMIRRNALIAAGNALRPPIDLPAPAERDLREAIAECLDDPDPLVRTTAQQVRERLASAGSTVGDR